MSISDDIKTRSLEVFRTNWQTNPGIHVPSPAEIKLSNAATYFERATVLYADLDASTDLVDRNSWWFAAEVYKSYLYASARIVSAEGGTITSYDGDRIMAIFVGARQTSNAALAALKINHAVKYLVQPELQRAYSTEKYVIRHKVGIDTSPIRAVRTGMRGDNDITWVGRAANYAAKLNAIPVDPEIWVTKAAFEKIRGEYKIWDNRAIWTKRIWSQMNDQEVYASGWTWEL